KALFFLTTERFTGLGEQAREQQDLAQEIVRRGHLIGNHTQDHLQLPLLSDQLALQQITQAEDWITQVAGERPWLVRPPGGARSARIDSLLAERHYTTVMWNLGSGDFQVRTPEEVLETWKRVLEVRERDFGERGGIILMHDTHEWSVDAFPLIHRYLLDRNCALLEQGEELYDIVDDPALFFVPRADADPSSEAPPADPKAEVLEARQRKLRRATRDR
ncbi:MAG: polysaccharide deacetylase family protein, partial [Myxococcales bacterium]|nr:polysaccharide deacetylase family protein [Myxococcales bacterium]